MVLFNIDDVKYKMGMDEWWCMWYKCPQCGETNIADGFNYCPDCGVKIEWIKTED